MVTFIAKKIIEGKKTTSILQTHTTTSFQEEQVRAHKMDASKCDQNLIFILGFTTPTNVRDVSRRSSPPI